MGPAGANFGRLMGLGLSENQREAIETIETALTVDNIRKGAECAATDVELRNMLRKSKVDMAVVEEKVKKISSLQVQMRLSAIKAMRDAEALLTPEQRKRLSEAPEGGPMKRGPDRMKGPLGMDVSPPGAPFPDDLSYLEEECGCL